MAVIRGSGQVFKCRKFRILLVSKYSQLGLARAAPPPPPKHKKTPEPAQKKIGNSKTNEGKLGTEKGLIVTIPSHLAWSFPYGKLHGVSCTQYTMVSFLLGFSVLAVFLHGFFFFFLMHHTKPPFLVFSLYGNRHPPMHQTSIYPSILAGFPHS